MALIRFSLDLAIPQDTYAAIPAATKTAFRDRVRALKALAVRINAGRPDEEASMKATWHVCRHDEHKPCDAEQDI